MLNDRWHMMSVEMARTAVGRTTIECCVHWCDTMRVRLIVTGVADAGRLVATSPPAALRLPGAHDVDDVVDDDRYVSREDAHHRHRHVETPDRLGDGAGVGLGSVEEAQLDEVKQNARRYGGAGVRQLCTDKFTKKLS